MTDKQQQAHDLYFATGKTQQEIADILDVSRKTINGWVRKNRWDEMKVAVKQMPSLILQDIYTHINAINDKIFSRPEDDRCPTMQEVSMLNRLLNMTKSIQKQHTGFYIEAFQELQLFIFNRNEELAMQLRGHIADYARGTLGDKEFMARKKRKNNVLDVTANLGRQEQREMNGQYEDEECNPNVTSCNPTDGVPDPACPPIRRELAEGQSVATPPTQHDPLAVQTGRSPSPLPQDPRAVNQAHPSLGQAICHPELVEGCNPNVTSSNPGVPHPQLAGGQSVATPSTQHAPLAVQTGCSPSPLPQNPRAKQVTPQQECNLNVTPCNPIENAAAEPAEGPKTFTVAANGEITPPENSEKGYAQKNSENVTLNETQQTAFLTKVLSMPPHKRPSPFIDGDIVWVLDRSHLERRHDTYGNKWGPMKMGYTVRYYPDVDPANAQAA